MIGEVMSRSRFAGLLIIACFLTVASIFSGCSIFGHGTEWTYSPMYPDSLTISGSMIVNDRILFELDSAFNSPCNEYSHAELKQNANDIYVKFYQRRDKSTICATVMVPTQISWSYTPLMPGDYRFHFWQSDTTSLDTTVTVL